MNQISVKEDIKSNVFINYVIEIHHMESETFQIFYEHPEISFLRFVLDCFFADYFSCDTDGAIIVNNNELISKYNEDSTQFNRRMTRLFFGMMQGHIENPSDFTPRACFAHKPSNNYYIRNLLELIDDISTKTYEGSSPFGSILFLSKQILAKNNLIRFAVKFTKDDRIKLDDSKRIRKLLELTNVDKDLYLIADENEIYGLGEVNWHMLNNTLTMRLDFQGLSKYKLVFIQTKMEEDSEGSLIISNEKKYYRSDLSLLESELLSVHFKNPRLGEEGYTTEKLIQTLTTTFNDPAEESVIPLGVISGEQLRRLDLVVRRAREQKHGTMVVITDKETAVSELTKLQKQSTLIEPAFINPEYIKYLTSIDGAIYFDTEGKCHAIGVILDGEASEDIGDASRGARFNSAHRYVKKLNHKGQKCAIAIISEDGMVDLIPEFDHEDKLMALANEIMDMINEKDTRNEKLVEKENLLLRSKVVDCDWILQIGEAYYQKKNYEKAIEFFDIGILKAQEGYVSDKYYFMKGNCHYTYDNEENLILAIEMYSKAIATTNKLWNKKINYNNQGMSSFRLCKIYRENKSGALENKLAETIEMFNESIKISEDNDFEIFPSTFNRRGICYSYQISLENDEHKKKALNENAIEDFSRAINLEPSNIYFANRSSRYRDLGRYKEQIEDLIQAELIKHRDAYVDAMSNTLRDYPELVADSIIYYNQVSGDSSNKYIEALFDGYAQQQVSSQLDEVASEKEEEN